MTEGSDPSTGRLEDFVATNVTKLQNGYLENKADAVAGLARLRHGASRSLGDDPELIGLTIAGLETPRPGLSDGPTLDERAAYTAITLFALHQQSHRTRRMHRIGYSMGRSARLLGRHSLSKEQRKKADNPVRRRFNALGTATSWDETVHHARSLIGQFRAFGIPLDYGRFAQDLVLLQDSTTSQAVRTAWGRDFYRTKDKDDEATAADEPAASDDGDDT